MRSAVLNNSWNVKDSYTSVMEEILIFRYFTLVFKIVLTFMSNIILLLKDLLMIDYALMEKLLPLFQKQFVVIQCQ